MALSEQHRATFASEIDLPLFINDCTYVPEPPMEVERKKIWYLSSLIPCIIVGKVHAFMGPLSKYIKKPKVL